MRWSLYNALTAGAAAGARPNVKTRALLIRLFLLATSGLLLVLVVYPQALVIHDPFAIAGRLRLEPPSSSFWLGTDHLGRDMLSRIIIATQPSLLIAGGVVILATAGGTIGGLLAGYYRRLDNVIMRIMDGMMAFPAILLALAIVAVLGRTVPNLIMAISVVYAPQIGRVCRSAVLSCREQDYVTAAIAGGGSDYWIMTRHLLPNVIPVLAVQATYFFARAILTEASLSFLGLGLPPDTPTWGTILGEGRRFLRDAPWTSIFPGLAIATAVIAINIIGDVVRDRVDPRLRSLDRSSR